MSADTGVTAPSSGELAYILSKEKYVQYAYDQDGSKMGNCTIGYGHKLDDGPCTAEDLMKYPDGWSKEMAYQEFLADVQQKGTDCINENVQVPLTQDQFDALTDLGFNAGCGALDPKTSELVRLLNQGKYEKVPDQIKRWVHGDNGEKIPGLVTRREDDARKFGEQPSGTPTPSPTPTPTGANCSADNPESPPTAGCDRVIIRIVPNYYPGDVDGGLGKGVGSASIAPGGSDLECLNPSNAPCVTAEDFPANTQVTITAQAGNQAPDVSTIPDSSFQMFTGCKGTGQECTLTATSNNPEVDVYFIPAVVKLTLDASPQANSEMSADAEGHVAGTDPISPVYCGAPGDAMGLPCSMLVRVHGEVVVQANDEGHGKMPTFSSNCPARADAPDYCDITLFSDQTVTATF